MTALDWTGLRRMTAPLHAAVGLPILEQRAQQHGGTLELGQRSK